MRKWFLIGRVHGYEMRFQVRYIFPQSIGRDHVTQIYPRRISRIRFDEKEMLEISATAHGCAHTAGVVVVVVVVVGEGAKNGETFPSRFEIYEPAWFTRRLDRRSFIESVVYVQRTYWYTRVSMCNKLSGQSRWLRLTLRYVAFVQVYVIVQANMRNKLPAFKLAVSRTSSSFRWLFSWTYWNVSFHRLLHSSRGRISMQHR